jgi:hypothetical protein
LSDSLGVTRSLPLLGKPIVQSNPLEVACFMLLLNKPIALDALAAALVHKALANVAVDTHL